MSAPATTIQVNGQAFARAPRVRAGTPLTPLGGTAGWYKPGVNGVLLMNPDGTPFAFASRNGGGFLVSAHMYDGRVRYMFSMTSRDEERLGATTMRDSHEIARAVLNQAGVIAA